MLYFIFCIWSYSILLLFICYIGIYLSILLRFIEICLELFFVRCQLRVTFFVNINWFINRIESISFWLLLVGGISGLSHVNYHKLWFNQVGRSISFRNQSILHLLPESKLHWVKWVLFPVKNIIWLVFIYFRTNNVVWVAVLSTCGNKPQ